MNVSTPAERTRKWKEKVGYGSWSAYGLSKEEYEAMLAEQENRCAICDSEGRLYIDHNHESGEVRSLLCQKCNIFVGFVETNPHLLDEVLAYIGGDDD